MMSQLRGVLCERSIESTIFQFFFFYCIGRLEHDDIDLHGDGSFVDGSDIDCKIVIGVDVDTVDGLSSGASVPS